MNTEMGVVIPFPSKAKPRPVLQVPTSDRVVRYWAEWSACNITAIMKPLPHNISARDNARARYVAALIEEQEGA